MHTHKGFFMKPFFKNESDGFSMFILNGDEKEKIVGNIPDYIPWTPLVIETDENGKIITLRETTYGMPKNGVIKFLRSCGLDQFEAQKVYEMAKDEDLFDVWTKTEFVENLRDLIGYEKEINAYKTVYSATNQRLFMEFLVNNNWNIPYSRIRMYVEAYMDSAVPNFKREPFKTGLSLGIPFEDIDIFASKRTDIRERILAFAMTQLLLMENRGSTCMPIVNMISSIESYLCRVGVNMSPAQVENILRHTGTMKMSCNNIGSAKNMMAESIIADKVRSAVETELFTDEELSDLVFLQQKELGITYSESQKKAFRLIKKTGLSILTGGPGTGKTTTINGLIKAYKTKYPDQKIMLASPTGRAAQRMTETTGMDSSTLHKITGQHKDTDKLDAGLIVIDEASMIDTELTAKLIKLIMPGSLVLMVGDTNQLPSVGAGKVLLDLIESGKVPVCQLRTVYRQTEDSLIVRNAIRVNGGVSDLITDNKTFIVREMLKESDMLEEIKKIIRDSPGNDESYQVLCTSHKGECGINEINKALQNMLNPKLSGKQILRFGNTEFREKDKVITVKNNYAIGYCNGDIGRISMIDDNAVYVAIRDKNIMIPRQYISDLSLAYCISVHKSQGSEFKHTIIVLPREPEIMLKRNLLYTAITRAKEKCTIITQKGSVKKCSETIDISERNTILKDLLRR